MKDGIYRLIAVDGTLAFMQVSEGRIVELLRLGQISVVSGPFDPTVTWLAENWIDAQRYL